MKTTKLPTISIMVITYNHGEFLAECLNSILSQQGPFKLDIHIADDASSDNAPQIAREYAKKHPEITAHINPKNLGPGANFHTHYPHLKGDFVAIIDGDDIYLDPTKLATELAFLNQHPEFVGVMHDTVFLHAPSQSILVNKPRGPISAQDFASFTAQAHISSGLWRNIFKGQLPVTHQQLECDIFHNILYAMQGPIGFIDKPFTAYRVHSGGSHSSLKLIQRAQSGKNSLTVYNTLTKGALEDAFAKGIAKLNLTIAKEKLRSGTCDIATLKTLASPLTWQILTEKLAAKATRALS